MLESMPVSDILNLIQRVGRTLKIEITIERVGDHHWDTVTGMLLVNRASREARILVRETDPVSYQNRCILHEVGHLLCGHNECVTSAGAIATAAEAGRALTLSELGSSVAERVFNEYLAEDLARAAEGRIYNPNRGDELAWGI
jgi:hypothetical protein